MPDLGIIEEGGRVFKKFSNLHLSTSCSDVTLVLGDTKLVAHRFVLGANSRVFETFLFGTDFAEHNQREVTVDAPVEAFKILLQYMYTGCLVLQEFDVIDVADFLELCHRYEILELEEQIENYLCVAVDSTSAVEVLKMAKVLENKRLQDLCWNLIDLIIEGHYDVDLKLPYNLLEEIVLKRKRMVTEIKLFKFVINMINTTNYCSQEQKGKLLSKIKLNKMSPNDIFKIVKPTKCFSDSELLELIEEIVSEDVQKLYYGTKITMKKNSIGTLGNKTRSCSFFCKLDLGKVYGFNHIKFKLESKPTISGSNYYVSVSKDGIHWDKVVDILNKECNDTQLVHFPLVTARFIRLYANGSNITKEISCSSFEILFDENPPTSFAGIIFPTSNVVVSDRALVISTNSSNSLQYEKQLLNGKFADKGLGTLYTSHIVEQGSLIIAFNQPYILDSCRFRLWDFDGRKYSYKVEILSDQSNYQIISNKADEKVDGWQEVKFAPRRVYRFRITGISATIGNELRLVHFEAPSQV